MQKRIEHTGMNSTRWYSFNPETQRLTIFASKLSTCVGMNPYQRSDRARFRDELGYALSRERSRAPHRHPELHLAKDVCPGPRLVGESTAARLGVQAEDVIRQTFSRQFGLRVQTSQRFYATQEPVMTLRDGSIAVHLGGRTDGLIGSDTVLEIKTRMNRYKGVTDHENVQVHAYMCITARPISILVESHQLDLGVSCRPHKVVFNACLWRHVQGKLAAFFEGIE